MNESCRRPFFFVTIMAAFQDSVHDTSPGMCVQASALGLSVGVVLGAAGEYICKYINMYI